MIVVRYTDDTVLGFEHREDAELFLKELHDRLAQFGLSVPPGKTQLIEFGRDAIDDRNNRGQGTPETFDLWYAAKVQFAVMFADRMKNA